MVRDLGNKESWRWVEGWRRLLPAEQALVNCKFNPDWRAKRESPKWVILSLRQGRAVAGQSPGRKHRGGVSGHECLIPASLTQVTCYHKGGRGTDRTLVFRVQFHTCTIHGPQLTFPKDQLDEAWTGEWGIGGMRARARGRAGRQAGDLASHYPLFTDERFPFQASVEFIFSSSPEKIKGKSRSWGQGRRLSPCSSPPGPPTGSTPRNDPSVTVDYNTAEPAVRWDSYENFNQHHEDSVDGVCCWRRGGGR